MSRNRRQGRYPALPDDVGGGPPFIGVFGEIALACPHQAFGLAREAGSDDHRRHLEHVGLALISRRLRRVPRDGDTAGEQRGFDVTGAHGARFRRKEVVASAALRHQDHLHGEPVGGHFIPRRGPTV